MSFQHLRANTATPAWVVLIVDDEPDVVEVTELVLGDLIFDGRPLEILSANSGAEGQRLFEQRSDIAVALIDVVMEHDRAGLDLVVHVRERLGNRLTRLILRTGQPGMAPEREVVTHFDIDDYKEKTELTADRLYATIYSALRSHQALWSLEQTRRGLSRVADMAGQLMRCQGMESFADEALRQMAGMAALLSLVPGAAVAGTQGLQGAEEARPRGLALDLRQGQASTEGDEDAFVCAGTGEFAPQAGQPLSRVVGPERAAQLARSARHGGLVSDSQGVMLGVDTGDGWHFALWVHQVGRPDPRVGALWEVFAAKVTDAARTLRAMESRAELAEAASRAKSQFLANISHEIRTPLNAVLGMLKLLQGTPLSLRQLDYVTKTQGAARSLLLLLNDVLDFSKAEANKMTLDPRPFRIDQMLRDLSVILSASVGEKSIEVLFDVDPQVPRSLVGDDLRLQQVLINLGANAIKFTQAGEVVIRMRLMERSPQDALIEFSVRDTGIGIASDQQAHIFSGFSQAEASTTRRFGGTGLGLAICDRLVGLMGGRITVDSELGRGSEFRFSVRLPLADRATSAAVLDEDPPAPSALRELQVLVIDDNATARAVLSTMVASLGWAVEVADSGPQALEMARRRAAQGRPYDVAFVDWQMPGMDGWETSLRLRHQGVGNDKALVMMVTAHGREMLADRSPVEQAELGGFLVKPVTASMLFDAVVNARLGSGDGLAEPVRRAPQRRLEGLRLLVVEDNPNNQQVAQELLEVEGAMVQLADNGQAGVDAVRQADPPFDAVLMDLQMPVMDGLAAARTLRADPVGASLPIIAMTANAMATDREACLDAGMTDHIGKPFELTDLVQCLLRHTGREFVAAELSDSRPALNDIMLSPRVLTLAGEGGVDVLTAVSRLGGQVGVYERMLRGFLRDVPGLLKRLDDALRTAAWERAAVEMHTLKGLGGTLGLGSLHADSAEAEKTLRTGVSSSEAERHVARVLVHVQRLTAVGDALVAALQCSAEVPDIESGLSMTDAEFQSQLQMLEALLGRSDMGAMAMFEQLRSPLTQAMAERFAELDHAVHALDFDRAVQICRGLRSDNPSQGTVSPPSG